MPKRWQKCLILCLFLHIHTILQCLLHCRILQSYFKTCQTFFFLICSLNKLWECSSSAQGCENTKTHLGTPAAPASIPAHGCWHCYNVWFRGSIEQKSLSEHCNRRAVMEDRLCVEPCLALALWSHRHIPQVLITVSTPWRNCGRNNTEDTWHLDACTKIHCDNWDTTSYWGGGPQSLFKELMDKMALGK